MGAPKFFKPSDIEIVRQAKENLARDPDSNALDDSALVAEVDRLMPFDAARERRLKAERIIRDQERPRKTPADGSLWLPGLEPSPYEPEQLLPDGSGKTVERDLATPHFVVAALERSADNLQKQVKAHRRKQVETDEFSTWAADQALAGRPNNEITYGNCVRERGFWRPDPVEEGDD